MKRPILILACIILCMGTYAQGVTTSHLTGFVSDENGDPIVDATILLRQVTTNTQLETFSQANGKYTFSNVKLAGEYNLIVSYLGKETVRVEGIRMGLGEHLNQNIQMQSDLIELEEISINAQDASQGIRHINKQGTHLDQQALEMFPTINRSILDYLYVHPYAGNSGFLGQGSRANFISIDGSGFNNVYGIGGPTASLIGNVVGAEPFGIDVIESIQLNTNPYDVKQSGFTGAAINAVTKSGTNDFKANLYAYMGHNNLVGNQVGGEEIAIPEFSNYRLGLAFSGALIKNKLFYMVNLEGNERSEPATNFLASRPGLEGDNVTRVAASDLEELSSFLSSNYDYETGPFEQYNNKRSNQKLLVKLDWLLNNHNRMAIRYNYLHAEMDGNTTNSGSFGSGNRVNNLLSMSFQNSGQLRTVKAHSAIAELFTTINSTTVNRASVSYSFFPDEREIKGELFPSVDILQQGKTYASFGSHLFASENRIDQHLLNVKNEISTTFSNHLLTLGFNAQLYDFEYNFTPAFAGSFVFNSLDDFYNSTPIGTLTPIGLSNGIGRPSKYSRRYAINNEVNESGVQPSFAQYAVYIQDEYQTPQFFLSGGVRFEYNVIGGTPLENSDIGALTFQDASGNAEQFLTNQLPDNQISISPRLGFSFLPSPNSSITIKGGAGIFTGLPSMVRVGDQFINNGLIQGEIKASNNQANQYPFSPDPNAYIPENLEAAKTYDVNFVVADYKQPQLFRTNLGIDYDLTKQLTFTANAVYSKDLYRDFVRNANLDQSTANIDAFGRFIFTGSKLNNPPVLGAYILDNSTSGNQYFFTVGLDKKMANNWFGNASYTYGKSEDVNSFGASTTRTAFRNLPVSENTNDPILAYSDFDLKHKVALFLGKQFNFLSVGHTKMSVFYLALQEGRFSYTYAGNGDVNKDGVPSNDLIYVPNSMDEISLEQYSSGGNPVTIEDQWAALDTYISNSDYLNSVRGQIAERNGSILPMYTQINLKLVQEVKLMNAHRFEFIADMFNIGNLINSDWGVRKIPANTRIIQAMQNGNFRVNPTSLGEEYLNDANLLSRWQIQFGIKYLME